MCGIAGATINMLGTNPEETLERMNAVMIHRGPDMGSLYTDSLMGLCHRRLSIIDLSEDGKQPMVSPDGRYIIVFNGEIYNFMALREQLEDKGYQFKTQTDTEVLMILYAEYGTACLKRLRGMFAFAIWDTITQTIFSARDRIGKKPFYYHWDGDNFAFASELKSLLEIKSIDLSIDGTAVIDYLKYLFIPHPKSIYTQIRKLEPGHFLLYHQGQLQIKEYWDVDFSKNIGGDTGTIEDELLEIIDDAVRCRLSSDVPLGAFLSGGVDSSGVVALMATALKKPVTTCTIGFDSKEHNEAHYAKAFARQMKTDHHEYYVDDDPAAHIKKLVWHFDEPFADSSMVPTFNVSNIARKEVTVALSGDGGDESFAGYEKYAVESFENWVRRVVPGFILRAVASLTKNETSGPLKKAHSLCQSAALDPSDAFYMTNTFITDDQLAFILSDDLLEETAGYNPALHIHRYYNKATGTDHLSRMLYTDLKMYLPGDILVKVDRMSMANSLEVRSPLLDHKVIEYAAKLPSRLKMRRKETKFVLKECFKKVLPKEVLHRKKHGFDVPLDRWFRYELKEMAEKELLQNPGISVYFKPRSLVVIWEEHQGKKANHGTLLWSLFVFSIWMNVSMHKEGA